MKDQRQLRGLLAHIHQLLNQGWRITSLEPLALKRGPHRLYYRHGMLVSER
ncbi:hypothetical protein QO209_10895 [Pseudomonas citronellolis]|uniref:hypothetical protein n=1 Tax=Pseudomonas TaxID=286 RepID=UPI0023D80FB4|nr:MULTISPECIES: hypothetical protein [Pseudomonas]MDN6872953.1 hypothetical protein [Pseudomonas citronellolis]